VPGDEHVERGRDSFPQYPVGFMPSDQSIEPFFFFPDDPGNAIGDTSPPDPLWNLAIRINLPAFGEYPFFGRHHSLIHCGAGTDEVRLGYPGDPLKFAECHPNHQAHLCRRCKDVLVLARQKLYQHIDHTDNAYFETVCRIVAHGLYSQSLALVDARFVKRVFLYADI
jgi:hypothetical protein